MLKYIEDLGGRTDGWECVAEHPFKESTEDHEYTAKEPIIRAVAYQQISGLIQVLFQLLIISIHWVGPYI